MFVWYSHFAFINDGPILSDRCGERFARRGEDNGGAGRSHVPHGSGATVVEPGARQEGQVASFPEGGNRGNAFGCHADSFGM